MYACTVALPLQFLVVFACAGQVICVVIFWCTPAGKTRPEMAKMRPKMRPEMGKPRPGMAKMRAEMAKMRPQMTKLKKV